MLRIGESRAPECIDGIRRRRHKRELLQSRSVEHLRGRSMSVPPRGNCTRISDEGRERRRSHASLIRSRSPARSIARKEDCTNVDDVPPDDTLCQICREINAEDIMSEPGYRHLPLSELRESGKSCGLCRIISRTIGLSWYWVRERSINRCSLILRRGQAVVVDADSNGDEVRRKTLKCFTNEFDPAAKVGVPWRRHLLTNTRSDLSFDVARLWLGDCCNNRGEHDQYSVQPNDLPSRLIDLAPMLGGAGRIALRNTRSVDFEPDVYCTLSYCWGTHSNRYWITTKNNLRDREISFDPSKLPATLRDAIFVAQQLRIRYIWIDALCIVQDDENDWAGEGSKMARIFKGSLLTIAACSSDSSTQGLFNSKSTSHLEDYLPHSLIRINNRFRDGRRSTLYFFEGLTGKGLRARYVYHGPLSTRAWCLQEHLLSPRTLYYTQSQIFWRCPHGDEYEDRLERHDYISLAKQYLYARDIALEYVRCQVWHNRLVGMYSELKLTKTSDKLVAISGLAEAINIRWQWKYVAGLWRESLAYGLCWKRKGPGKKSSTYRCPSWSWASQDSAVHYSSVLGMELEASIINVEVDVDRRNQYGAVTSGSLTLHASLMRGIVVPAQKSDGGEYKISFRINDEVLTPASPAVWMDDDFLFGNEVYCVWLATDWMKRYGLILARTEQERTYRRIGFSEVRTFHTGGWPQIPKSEVVII